MKFRDKLAITKATTAKVWALTTPFFSSEQKWKARALLAAIVLLNLGAVYMLVQINEWNRVFYDALEKHDQPVFWAQLLRFTWLAFAYIIIAVYKFYLTQLLEVRWRAWMTAHYLQRWLSGQAFYRMELARFSGNGAMPDNPDQRIQEDLNLFTTYSVSLSMGLLNALVTLASFVGILWSPERRASRSPSAASTYRDRRLHGLGRRGLLRGGHASSPTTSGARRST